MAGNTVVVDSKPEVVVVLEGLAAVVGTDMLDKRQEQGHHTEAWEVGTVVVVGAFVGFGDMAGSDFGCCSCHHGFHL